MDRGKPARPAQDLPALGISYITFNNRKPPFDDVRVRRALTISVDREQIAERIMVVGVPPAHTMTPSVVSNYDNPVPDYAHRPMPERLAEARACSKPRATARTGR